jgi:hypothetical protein
MAHSRRKSLNRFGVSAVTLESANYVIKLNKTVKAAADVRSVEQELIEALLVIAAAWPFSGGSNLVLDSHRQIHSRRFESNALVIEQALLKGAGRSRLSGENAMNVESVATYAQPPLSSAVRIGQHARTDFRSWQLLHYYQRAYADKSSWFVVHSSVQNCRCLERASWILGEENPVRNQKHGLATV